MTLRAVVAVTLAAVTAGLSAVPAHAVSRAKARAAAMAALHPQKLKGYPALFDLPAPLPKGAVVSGLKLRKRAHLFWLDYYQGALFAHPSLVLLVDARSGKITGRRKLLWQPRVNGREPAFGPDRPGYWTNTYRVYARRIVLQGPAPAARRSRAVRALAADAFKDDCMVTIGDKQLLAGSFTAMKKWADSVHLESIHARDAADLDAKVGSYTRAGCEDVLVYAAGHGVPPPGWFDPITKSVYAGGPAAVLLEAPPKEDSAGATVPKVTLKNLEKLVDKYPRTEFKIKIDSCFAGRFEPLKSHKNVRVLEVATNDSTPTQGYMKDAVIEKDGKLINWATVADNPDAASEFTNGDIHGLRAWAESATEMSEHPGLAGAIERSLPLGSAYNGSLLFPESSGRQTKPDVFTNPPLSKPCTGEATATFEGDAGEIRQALPSAVPKTCDLGFHSGSNEASYYSIYVYNANDSAQLYYCHQAIDPPKGEQPCPHGTSTPNPPQSVLYVALVKQDRSAGAPWEVFVNADQGNGGPEHLSLRIHYSWKAR